MRARRSNQSANFSFRPACTEGGPLSRHPNRCNLRLINRGYSKGVESQPGQGSTFDGGVALRSAGLSQNLEEGLSLLRRVLVTWHGGGMAASFDCPAECSRI
jgi:hypothetical protein